MGDGSETLELMRYRWLVVAVAKRFMAKFSQYRGMGTIEDLIQIGWIGLIKGYRKGKEKFDPTKSNNMGIYLRSWVWGAMYREIISDKGQRSNPPWMKTNSNGLAWMQANWRADNWEEFDASTGNLPPLVKEFLGYIVSDNETMETALARCGVWELETPVFMELVKDSLREVVNYYDHEHDTITGSDFDGVAEGVETLGG